MLKLIQLIYTESWGWPCQCLQSTVSQSIFRGIWVSERSLSNRIADPNLCCAPRNSQKFSDYCDKLFISAQNVCVSVGRLQNSAKIVVVALKRIGRSAANNQVAAKMKIESASIVSA
jgi:hypothetical protein